jgi:hypothetical protein
MCQRNQTGFEIRRTAQNVICAFEQYDVVQNHNIKFINIGKPSDKHSINCQKM